MENLFKVSITTPGQIIVFRGKKVRSPAVFHKVTKSEIPVIETQARRLGLKYEINDDIPEPVIVKKDIVVEKSEAEIEELSDIRKPTTILEKLISQSEN